MGLTSFQSGRDICEVLCISPLKLAEFCHAGKLAAYRFEDRERVLASSQCNMKFKYPECTAFTLKPSGGVGIIAISKRANENFSIYAERKLNDFETHEKSKIDVMTFKEAVSKSARIDTNLRLKNIVAMEIRHCNRDYVTYYNKLEVAQSNMPAGFVKLYRNDKIFFELVEREGDIDLEYIEMNCNDRCYIKRCVTKLCVKKEQSSCGTIKYVLSEYDDNIIKIKSKKSIISSCCIEVDERRVNCDRSYKYKCDSLCAYLQQYSVDYFRKEDLSFSMPLKHEVDFFVFEYDNYRKCYHFLEDEDVSRKKFFKYIENLVFDVNEVKNVMEYDIVRTEIKQDPQRYMKERCLELEKNSNYDDETLKIIRAYRMAITGSTWKAIHKEVWPHRSQEASANDRFVSGKLDKFKSIAKLNNLPFIKAKALRDMNVSEKETIAEDMLKQLATFHTAHPTG